MDCEISFYEAYLEHSQNIDQDVAQFLVHTKFVALYSWPAMTSVHNSVAGC